MRILICSDTHLGYRRKACEGIWSQAYLQFERILSVAVHRQVDCILHSGDFFDGTCSSEDMAKVSKLMQHYLCGKQKTGVSWRKKVIVSPMMIPFVAIAGNHDGKVMSSLEVLKSFGYVESPDMEVYPEKEKTMYTMYPFVVTSGEESIAVYGMDYMDQEEACKMWNEDRVRVCKPIKKCSKTICLIHQDMESRYGRPAFPREKMPFDYVIYGHEHNQVIYSDGKSIQPGSSCPLRISSEDIDGKSAIFMEMVKGNTVMERIDLCAPWVINEKIQISENIDEKEKENEIVHSVKRAFDRDGYGIGRVTFVYRGRRGDLPDIHTITKKARESVKNTINSDIIRYELIQKNEPKRKVEENTFRPREFIDILKEELAKVKMNMLGSDLMTDMLSDTVQSMEASKRRKYISDVIKLREEEELEQRKRKLNN